jgi:hypothetical protein
MQIKDGPAHASQDTDQMQMNDNNDDNNDDDDDDDDDQSSQNSESLYCLAQRNRAEIQGAMSKG